MASIQEDYSCPEGFKSSGKRTGNLPEVNQTKQHRFSDPKKQSKKISETENPETKRIKAYLAGLSEVERRELEQQVCKDASLLRMIDTEVGKANVRQFLIHKRVKRILAAEERSPTKVETCKETPRQGVDRSRNC